MTSYLFPEGWARRLLWSSCKWHSKDWLAAGSAAPAPGAAGCHPCDMPGNPSSSLNCPVTAASPSCCTSSLSLAWVHTPLPGTLLAFAEDCGFIFNTESFTSVAPRVSFAGWHPAVGGNDGDPAPNVLGRELCIKAHSFFHPSVGRSFWETSAFLDVWGCPSSFAPQQPPGPQSPGCSWWGNSSRVLPPAVARHYGSCWRDSLPAP